MDLSLQIEVEKCSVCSEFVGASGSRSSSWLLSHSLFILLQGALSPPFGCPRPEEDGIA